MNVGLTVAIISPVFCGRNYTESECNMFAFVELYAVILTSLYVHSPTINVRHLVDNLSDPRLGTRIWLSHPISDFILELRGIRIVIHLFLLVLSG